jgi:hypothetical protein
MTQLSYGVQPLSEVHGYADKTGVMSPARFGVQAVLVLCLIVLVSWPDHRLGARDASWWTKGAAGSDAAFDLGRISRGSRYEIGWGLASLKRRVAAANASQQREYEFLSDGRTRRVTPAAVVALGGRVNAITGDVRTLRDEPIGRARLVLRNVMTGAIEAWATADENGQFAFVDVMPSGYVVELLGSDGTVAATSEFVAVSAGDVRQTSVRLAGRTGLAPFGTLAPTAGTQTAAAAAGGVHAVTEPPRPISPQR